MQGTANNEKTIVRARMWGLWWAYLIVPNIILSIVASSVASPVAFEIAGLVLGLATGLSYLLLLMGIQAMAKEIQNESLQKNMSAAIFLNAALMVGLAVTSLPSLVSDKFTGLLYFAMLPILVALGIISIRLGIDFNNLVATWGENSRKAGKWHRISGYLLVSILLLPIGLVLSLIADYYMWRLIKERALRRDQHEPVEVASA